MLVGLQGSGKTTASAKLARYITKQGRRPLLVAADPYRPAAVDQLQTLGKQIDIPVYRAPTGTQRARHRARARSTRREHQARDVLILDTAGRTSIDEPMLDEIRVLGKQCSRPRRCSSSTRWSARSRSPSPRRSSTSRRSPARADQDRRRRPRRRGALDQRRDRAADQVRGHRREDRRARAVPSRPPRRPHPGHGRRADARRARPGERRPEAGRGAGAQAAAQRRSPSRTSWCRCSSSRRWVRSAACSR